MKSGIYIRCDVKQRFLPLDKFIEINGEDGLRVNGLSAFLVAVADYNDAGSIKLARIANSLTRLDEVENPAAYLKRTQKLLQELEANQ